MLHDEGYVPVAPPSLIRPANGPVVVISGATLPAAVDSAVTRPGLIPVLQSVHDTWRTLGRCRWPDPAGVIPQLHVRSLCGKIVAQELKLHAGFERAVRIRPGDPHLNVGKLVSEDRPAALLHPGLKQDGLQLGGERLLGRRGLRTLHW